MGVEWNDLDDARLHRLWMVEGMSSGKIALEFPGRSRNAVIGRIHRLGFKRGFSAPLIAFRYPKRVSAPKPPRLNKPNPPLGPLQWAAGQGSRQPKPPTRIELMATGIESPDRKPWLERGFGECAFIVSGEGADAASCCNAVKTKTDYCSSHYTIMYQTGTANKPKDMERLAKHMHRRAA